MLIKNLVKTLFLFYITTPFISKAQLPSPTRTLDSLLRISETRFPFIKSKFQNVEALKSGVQFKKNGIIPQVNIAYQVDYATYNNITGMIYPQYIIPISGPPSSSNNYQGVPGSALAINLNWDPITFGARKTEIQLAQSKLGYGLADQELSIFQQKYLIIRAWLNYSLLVQLKKVFEKNLERAQFNYRQSQSLVISGLKPGTDSSVLGSEKIRSQIQLLGFKQKLDSSIIQLKYLVGDLEISKFLPDTLLLNHLPSFDYEVKPVENPEIKLIKAGINSDEWSLKLARKSVLPKLLIWATGYGRGSGISYNGLINSNQGWGFERYNYGFGAQLSVPVLEVFRQKAHWKEMEFNIRSNKFLLELSESRIHSGKQIIDSAMKSSLLLAQLSPSLEKSAQFSNLAIKSRYKSGLTSYYELIGSEQELVRAQVSKAVFYFQVWNTLLNQAAFSGDLEIFLSAYRK